ncbi:MAG: glycosyl hydrolase family 2 [Prevotella sp.]|nr:glycosyl hydrolase family 2 [Prevotella sp.]
MRKITISLLLAFSTLGMWAQSWPEAKPEARAGLRWWWLGSAVDEENLRWNMQEYSRVGAGALEITPIYGVQDNDANNIPFLSDRYMEILRFVMEEGRRDSIEIDMATGTGWPFGGPWVPLEESACRSVFVQKSFTGDKVENLDLLPDERSRKNAVLHKVMLYGSSSDASQKRCAIDVTNQVKDGLLTWNASKANLVSLGGKDAEKQVVALYIKYGIMRVKRAAPGGEGLVVDHFNHQAVANYLKHISDAFERTGTPYPHTFFNDSYEVADGDWTPSLLEEFQERRGYQLEEFLPELIAPNNPALNKEQCVKVISDYRETLADLLLESFTNQWTAWAHSHGAITRNQAHGSPANLIDCYSAVDIPEIEGFGLSDFGIRGLRRDPGMTRKNDSDLSMLKYASSAAHITGKPFTSSETFTWLTEHFRTSLSQMKPDLDLMFCAGVNHMYFHGTCYSPKDDPWPGWKFYASIDMSPTNSIWRDAPYLMKYIERCQSFLQMGQPDNDFLVYLPVRDMWKKDLDRKFMQFSIHNMGKRAPEFIQSVLKIDRLGYDCDYISERQLEKVSMKNGQLVTAAGTRYKAIIIPTGTSITSELKKILQQFPSLVIYGEDETAMAKHAKAEKMKTELGLRSIRRTNEEGHHYFIANLTPNDVDSYLSLAVPTGQAIWFNPMTGDIQPAEMSDKGVRMYFRSGESRILKVENGGSNTQSVAKKTQITSSKPITPPVIENGKGKFQLSFVDEQPNVEQTFFLDSLQTWESLSDAAAITMGTGVYTTTFRASRKQAQQHWLLDLGDVRESARVYINDEFIGCAWAVPFILDCQNAIRKGKNTLRIEVTNLPANRIANLDRQGYKWRKFNGINVVDLNYQRTTYGHWQPVPSGLNSPIRFIPAE